MPGAGGVGNRPPARVVQRSMRTKIALFALIGLVAAACGSGSGTANGSWQLQSGTLDGRPIPLVATHPVTMTIDGNEISGVAACNQYQGRVDVSADRFSLADVAVTEMACEPPEVMDAEAAFLSALGDATTIELGTDRLTLTGPRSELVFVRATG